MTALASTRMTGLLLEREEVLDAGTRALATAARGEPGILAIRGEAGTGKTSVLDAMTAAAEGFTIVRARGEEMETGLSFALLERLLSALEQDATSVAPADGEPVLEPSVPHLRALERLRAVATTPLLLALDDLQWADADSLTTIAFLARRLDDLPVVLAVGVRGWPSAASDVVDDLAVSTGAHVHELEPLSAEAGRVLLEVAAGEAEISEETALRAHEQCGGNPLLLTYVAAELRRGTDPLDALAGQEDLLLRRFAGLDADALALARGAALLGVRFHPGVAAALAELTHERAALGELAQRGLIVADGDHHMRFTHPLLRQALYEDVAPAVRQRWHAAAFAELVRRGRSVDAAEHAVRADLAGDPEAAAVLERVGRQALAAGGLRVAVERLQAAAHVLGDQAGAPLLLTLAEALCAVGRVGDAAQRCREVLDKADLEWRSRVDALVLLGRCSYLDGEADHGTWELQQAVDLAAAHDELAAIGPLLEQVVSTWMAAGPGHALPFAERAREIAHRSGDRELRERTDIAWGDVAMEAGDRRGPAATRPAGRWLQSPARAADLPTADLVSPLSALYPFAHCAFFTERFDEAQAAFDLAAARLSEAGAATGSSTAEIFRSNLLIRRGRLQEALDANARAGRYAEFITTTIPVVAAQRAVILTWMGRTADALAARERALRDGPVPWPVHSWIAWSDGLRALWAGSASASDDFLELERILTRAGVREANHTPYFHHAVAAHLLAGREDDAARVLAALQAAALEHPGRWPAHAVALSQGFIHQHAGRFADATRSFDEAAELLGDADLPLSRAEALLAAGTLLRREGRLVAARAPLAEARRLAEDHDAGALARLAADELRLAGGRRRRDDTDRDVLTVAELRVARAAAAGATNAEIAASLHLSTNTVASHLKRVYGKLGIDGRRRLNAVVLPDDDGAHPAV